jgi:hypothetical protein
MEQPMPWNNPIEYPFNTHAVKENAPAASGVYALCDGDKWVYLGASDNLQHALLAHLDPSTASYMDRVSPTTFSFELHPFAGCELRLQQLIQELQPLFQH